MQPHVNHRPYTCAHSCKPTYDGIDACDASLTHQDGESDQCIMHASQHCCITVFPAIRAKCCINMIVWPAPGCVCSNSRVQCRTDQSVCRPVRSCRPRRPVLVDSESLLAGQPHHSHPLGPCGAHPSLSPCAQTWHPQAHPPIHFLQ